MALFHKKYKEQITLISIFLLALSIETVYANCKAHDAAWDAVKGLTITQPSKLDPTKLKLDWTLILNNARCVDNYFVYVWKKNALKETAVKTPVANKTATSYIIDVEACIEYNFMVESIENDLFRTEIRQSQVTPYKSEAVPRLVNTDKKNFIVSYYYDKAQGVNDLTKVSIQFPKNILEHASCIKHIEIKGTLDLSGGGRLYSQAASGQFGSSHGYYLRSQNSTSTSTYSSYSSSTGGSSRAGVGGSGQYPGSSGSGVGGSGQYPGSSGSGVGGSGQYPGSSGSGVGGSGQYPGSSGSGVGGSGQYPGSSGSGHIGRPEYHPDLLYPDHTHTQGWHGRPPYTSQGSTGYPSHGRVKREKSPTPAPPIGYPTTTTNRPPYTGGQPSVTAAPPFLFDTIEIIVDHVEACKPYRFHLKVLSPQNLVLGEIDNLILPPLADMPDYHPPPLSRMFRVQLQGPNMPPLITLQPGMGVPNSCLAEFFEAVDRHMQRLEADLNFHLRQETKAHGSIDYFKRQLSDEGSAQLKLLGCKCNSTSLILTTNDTTVKSKFEPTFGTYYFEGMHQGKPYYRSPSRHQQAVTLPAKLPPASSTPPPIGYGAVTTTTTTPAPAAAHVKVHYLYWDSSDKAWMVGESLGGSSPTHKTTSKSLAACPADPEAAKTWTHTATFKWKSDPNMKFDCPPNILY